MGENSKIEWCDHTFNPWIGCQKVSPGCDHCYAEAMMDLEVLAGCSGDRTVSASERRMTTGGSRAVGQRTPTAIDHECSALPSPIGSIIKRRAQWRSDLGRLIEGTPELDWLLLTKAPGELREACAVGPRRSSPNVWLGVTCEDQLHYERRWEILSWARIRATIMLRTSARPFDPAAA